MIDHCLVFISINITYLLTYYTSLGFKYAPILVHISTRSFRTEKTEVQFSFNLLMFGREIDCCGHIVSKYPIREENVICLDQHLIFLHYMILATKTKILFMYVVATLSKYIVVSGFFLRRTVS